jgi:hypothetical protein
MIYTHLTIAFVYFILWGFEVTATLVFVLFLLYAKATLIQTSTSIAGTLIFGYLAMITFQEATNHLYCQASPCLINGI